MSGINRVPAKSRGTSRVMSVRVRAALRWVMREFAEPVRRASIDGRLRACWQDNPMRQVRG